MLKLSSTKQGNKTVEKNHLNLEIAERPKNVFLLP